MLLDDLQRRLTGLTVLTPGEATTPGEWTERDDQGRRKAKGEQGLGAYFQHVAPAGYVQLRHVDVFDATDVVDLGRVNVEAIAATLPAAQALAAQIRNRLGGRTVQPTPYRYVNELTDEQDGYTRVVLTFETRAIGV
ncbi:hypothetical protein [Deinococcus radiotolerans]|uniref:Uncharacterized protein n=1 Tax=Deinococcus radiotolerans TaxID=1309407 RepID=A0ABQ2FR74_9DEIO|nr:hypothetical protein [Deinococcus radiotolerans]GGL18360.1 hypothetical protein GCM10010844_41490 [Deinococcus radiotolerans]